MSSNFLPNRIKNLRGWIPETDVDGIDMPKENFVSDTENIVYENGFLRCDKKPITVSLPFTPTADEVLLSATNFYHSSRGRVWVYSIWNSATSQFYVYIRDEGGTSGYSSRVYLKKGPLPDSETSSLDFEFANIDSINYAEFDDTLKINTGGTVRLRSSASPDDTMATNEASFSLAYITDEYDYITGGGPTTNYWIRQEGWFLSVRWLGSSYYEIGSNYTPRILIESDETSESYMDDRQMKLNSSNFVGHPLVSEVSVGIIVTSWINITPSDSFQVDDIVSVDYLHLAGYTPTITDVLRVTIYGPSDTNPPDVNDPILFQTDVVFGSTTEVSQDIPVHIMNAYDGSKAYPKARMVVLAPNSNAADIRLEEFNFHPIDSFAYMTQLQSQQARIAGVNTDNDDDNEGSWIPMFDIYMKIKIRGWDWDMRDSLSYHYLYTRFNNETLYYKAGRSLSSYAYAATYFEFNMQVKDGTNTTLNFDYGLGSTVVAFPIKNNKAGHRVLNETYYKNRSYVVIGDKNIYLSHIAGNGRLQSDSFPYNKSVEFGFIYGDNSDELFIAISVTPLDEIILLSSTSTMVYAINPTQGTVYRKLKAINGSAGIGHAKSLVKHITGKPIAEVLLWADKKGIYIYGGGVRPPKNIVEGTLTNYWRDFYTDSIIGAYNPMRNEALFISGDLAVVLDLGTLTWRKIRFPAPIKEFIGIVELSPYFLTTANQVIYLDEKEDSRMSGVLVTHYQTNYTIDEKGNFIPLSEMTDKIMQELYVSMNKLGTDTGSPIGILYDIIADGNVVGTSTYFSGQTDFQKVLSPLLIRYRRVKIRMVLSGNDFHVRDFGYTFNVKTTERTGLADDISNSGFGTSFGNDFGIRL